MKKIFYLLFILVLTGTLKGQVSFDDYNSAVELINKAKTSINDKRYQDAIGELESAIKLDSTFRDCYEVMYKAGFFADNKEVAKFYLKKAQSIFVEDDEIIYYLGKIIQTEKKYGEAIKVFDEAIKFGKKNGEDYPIVYDYYASRGICYLRLEKYAEALADFEYAIQLNWKKGSIFANRGIVLFKLNQPAEACLSWKIAYSLGELGVQKYIEKNCK
jgi:tetratricopeptide (TPR) repeat protein